MAAPGRFGSAVVLGDLDDFLAPTQACVNPLFVEGQKSAAAAAGPPEVAQVTLHSGIFSGIGNESVAPGGAPAPKRPDLIKADASDAARVSLTDCLACSGCVTSAETVLIKEQSVERLVAVLQKQRAAQMIAAAEIVTSSTGTGIRTVAADESGAAVDEAKAAAKRVVVVSVSPQAQASIATYLGISAAAALARLVSYFKDLGVARVYDTSPCLELSVIEACVEFGQRFVRRRAWRWEDATTAKKVGAKSAPAGSPAAAATAAAAAPAAEAPKRARPADDETEEWHSALPMLSSSCPGWICFAEKRHPPILPYIATTKSAQAITGTLVKRFAAHELGVDAKDIFHATLMPCFDKKLEASRRDFTTEGAVGVESSVREVDLVVTPIELLEAWEDGTVVRMGKSGAAAAASVEDGTVGEGSAGEGSADSLNLPGIAAAAPPSLLPVDATATRRDDLLNAAVRVVCRSADAAQRKEGSGGYLERIYRFACEYFFDVPMHDAVSGSPLPLQYAAGRSSDWLTVELALSRAEIAALRERKPGPAGEYLDRFLEFNKSKSGSSASGDDDGAAASKITVLRFAAAYGFGNVQKAVRHIRQHAEAAAKTKKGGGSTRRRRRRTATPQYDFIEMMACPGGCLNGGGQLPSAASAVVATTMATTTTTTTTTTAAMEVEADEGKGGRSSNSSSSSSIVVGSRATKEVRQAHLDAVTALYHADRDALREEQLRFVRSIYAWTTASPAWSSTPRPVGENELLLQAAPTSLSLSESARRLLHTRYHAVAPMNPLTIKW